MFMFPESITDIKCVLLLSDLTWAVMTLFLIGKLGITISFAVLYTYTAEMMPTTLRSCGVGASSTISRFGAMLAPFVPLLVSFKMIFMGYLINPNQTIFTLISGSLHEVPSIAPLRAALSDRRCNCLFIARDSEEKTS